MRDKERKRGLGREDNGEGRLVELYSRSRPMVRSSDAGLGVPRQNFKIARRRIKKK